MPKKFIGLNSREYEHPLDKVALDKLQKIPGLPALTKKFYEISFEKILRIENTGQYLEVTKKNFPKLVNLYHQACEILDMDKIPELYMKWEYTINAQASGVEDPMILLHSGCLDLLSDEEILFILGHELGHIKSAHVLYQMLGQYLVPIVANSIGNLTLGLGSLVTEGLKYPLYHWMRMAELTSDRAGMLCCQERSACLGVFMKWAGVPIKYQTKDFEEEFIIQSKKFQEQDYDSMDKFIKGFSQTYSLQSLNYGILQPVSHPWTLYRVKQLIEWIDSGKYQSIFNKTRLNNILNRCTVCSSKINKDDKYCGYCGSKIKQ